NNIISVLSGPAITLDRTASVNDLNNNCYYSPVAPVAILNITNYNDLVSMRGIVFTGSDANSVAKDPKFVSSANLDPTGSCLVGKTSSITKDIYNTTRGNPPSMGAKEVVSSAINDIAVESYVSPVNPFSTGAQDLVLAIKNYGSNSVS